MSDMLSEILGTPELPKKNQKTVPVILDVSEDTPRDELLDNVRSNLQEVNTAGLIVISGLAEIVVSSQDEKLINAMARIMDSITKANAQLLTAIQVDQKLDLAPKTAQSNIVPHDADIVDQPLAASEVSLSDMIAQIRNAAEYEKKMKTIEGKVADG